MKRNFVAVGLVLAGLAAWTVSRAASGRNTAEPLTGTWQLLAHTGDGDHEFKMTLEQTGSDVKGSITTPDGESLEITSGTFKDGALEFHLETQDSTYVVTGKLKDGQLSGDYTNGGDQKGTWEAKRSEERTK